jgi:uncharacterized membrane protein
MSRDVHFINGYNQRVEVAVAYANSSCSRLWAVRGWWGIEPGGSAYVLDTDNRYMFFYAESSNRVWVGSGDNYADVYVTQQAFDRCVEIGSTNARIVRMRFLDLDVNNRWRLT